MSDTETHPLPPFAPQNARLLMLGSFPPPRERWKMDFYYPNIQNDMWRILGLVFFNDREHFVSADGKGFREAAIRDFLGDKGIAISDTAHRIRRLQGNAADKSLQILEPLELAALLARLPRCHAILTTANPAVQSWGNARCNSTACLLHRAPIRWRWRKKRKVTAPVLPPLA